jgi:hypothetical protein
MVHLEPEQEELLALLCVTTRKQPKGERASFLALELPGGQSLRHPHLPGTGDIEDFYWPDLEVLALHGFIAGLRHNSSFMFEVLPEGFEQWELIEENRASATTRIEQDVRRLIEDDVRRNFPSAYAKWSLAERQLWVDGPVRHAEIGKLCREAMRFFSERLLVATGAHLYSRSTNSTQNIRAALQELRPLVPENSTAMLDALASYWGTLADQVEDQAHEVIKQVEGLAWEDSRAVVFQTALVMYELCRALDRVQPK